MTGQLNYLLVRLYRVIRLVYTIIIIGGLYSVQCTVRRRMYCNNNKETGRLTY